MITTGNLMLRNLVKTLNSQITYYENRGNKEKVDKLKAHLKEAKAAKLNADDEFDHYNGEGK
jgi:hypothetical protein